MNLFKVILISFLMFFSTTVFANHFDKIVYVVFENEDYADVLKNNYFSSLAQKGLLMTNFHGEVHPSQGNYLAMIAGDFFNIRHDGNVDLNEKHIGDLLEDKKLTWKTYAEDYPENCYLTDFSGKYARKHVPFLSFTNVTKNKERCNKGIVNYNSFLKDVEKNQLSNFNLVIPNEYNDGHDSNLEVAGAWIKKNIEPLFDRPELKNTLFIILFDEALKDKDRSNHIYSVLISKNLPAGNKFDQNANHISLIKLMQSEWDLGSLGKKDSISPLLKLPWKN